MNDPLIKGKKAPLVLDIHATLSHPEKPSSDYDT